MPFLDSGNDDDLNRLVTQLNPILKHINLHRFIWILTVISGLIAWNRGLAFLYALVAFLLAALTLSYLFSYLNLKNLLINRKLTDVTEVDQPTQVSYELFSPGKRHFIQIHELLINETTFRPTFVSHHNKYTQISQSQTFKKRGFYQLADIELSCGYPLGFFIRKKTIKTPLHQLIVVPQMFHISSLPEMESLNTANGPIRSRHDGSQDEFASLRDYQRGDSLKNIHWPVTAKQMSKGLPWQVKTFETHDQPIILIVLNQQDLVDNDFELMLSIAASIAKHSTLSGFYTRLTGLQGRSLWSNEISPHSQNILYDVQCLADLQPSSGNYSNTINQALSLYNKSNLAVIFSNKKTVNLSTTVNSLHFQFQKTKKHRKKTLNNHTKWRINSEKLDVVQLSEMFR